MRGHAMSFPWVCVVPIAHGSGRRATGRICHRWTRVADGSRSRALPVLLMPGGPGRGRPVVCRLLWFSLSSASSRALLGHSSPSIVRTPARHRRRVRRWLRPSRGAGATRGGRRSAALQSSGRQCVSSCAPFRVEGRRKSLRSGGDRRLARRSLVPIRPLRGRAGQVGRSLSRDLNARPRRVVRRM
jgi:hypothetical protein